MLTDLVSIDPELFNFVVKKIEREKHFDQGGIVPRPYIWSIFQHHESVDFTPRKTASKETNDTKPELETIPTVNPIERNFWAATRLHNGPGLYDQKSKAKVRLPKATRPSKLRLHGGRKVPTPQSLAALVGDLDVQTKAYLGCSEDVGIKKRLPQWWHPWADRSILVAR
jgi:hypothetical protein